MTHPYESYIESKAEDYFSRQAHEPRCDTLQPYDYSKHTDSYGFFYDFYVPPHCDCWLSENFDNLTTERKFEALRALSHRFGLHSAACGRYRSEKITYRNKPEVLRFPCDCWLSVDFPKDISYTIENDNNQEQENTISDLSRAIQYAEAAEQAQRNIDNFLAPFIEHFVEFQQEFKTHWDHRDSKADTFKEIDGNSFWIVGEETYEYGEYYAPSFNLPFEFIENPAAFKEEQIRVKREREAKEKAAQKRSAEERVTKLREQLARAEADLAKANEQKDPIKKVATRNQAEQLRDQLDISGDQG